MPLEAAQILCTALHRYGIDAPYRPTHAKHPSVLWAGDSVEHFRWLRRFGRALCREYSYRYGRRHGCERVLDSLPLRPPIPGAGWHDPPQAMPEMYRRDDAVAAYRAYYRGDKASFPGKGAARWTRRKVPPFMVERAP